MAFAQEQMALLADFKHPLRHYVSVLFLVFLSILVLVIATIVVALVYTGIGRRRASRA